MYCYKLMTKRIMLKFSPNARLFDGMASLPLVKSADTLVLTA